MSQSLMLLQEYRQRFSIDLAPVRAELVGWFRSIFKKKKPTPRALHLFCRVNQSEGNQPRWVSCWDPGPHNRYWVFEPAYPLPSLISEEEVHALGLFAWETTLLRYIAYHDLVVDAWGDAGGFGFVKPLSVDGWVCRGPDEPRPWIVYLREEIRKAEAGERSRVNRRPLARPAKSFHLPEVSAEIIAAVQAGQSSALRDWADALVEKEASIAAEMLRLLSRFPDRIGEEVKLVAPAGGFFVYSHDNEHASWVIGDCDCEITNEDTRNLEELLAGWNDFHPAIEWLYRRLDLPLVIVESKYLVDGQIAEQRSFYLAGGDHFVPCASSVRVTSLLADSCGE